MNWWLFVYRPMKPELTQTRLKELLHYDPETGVFTRLVSNNNRFPVGSKAGSDHGDGYRVIKIDRTSHKAHRLAFLYMTGEFPPAGVDHVNRVKDDNRWENLRPATQRENQGNIGLRSNNASGYRGVSWNKHSGKWMAQGRRDGRLVYLGYYTQLEEAAAAARAWRDEYFSGFSAA